MPDFSARVDGTPTKLISHRIVKRGRHAVEQGFLSFAVTKLETGEEGR